MILTYGSTLVGTLESQRKIILENIKPQKKLT